MPKVSRVNDKAACPSDSHGKDCCSHGVTGPAVQGSPDVMVNNQPVLRIGDPGVHSACCGPNTWKCAEGSATVLVNNMPVVRVGDATSHCGGSGKMVEGSPDVIIGGSATGGGGISPPPPDCPLCEEVNAGGVSVSTSSPNPVHAPTGAKFLTEAPDFSLPGNIPLVWTRSYSSLNTHEGPLGPGWSVPYFVHLVVNKPAGGPDDCPNCLINPQGRAVPFVALDPGEVTLQPSEGLALSRDYDNVYTLEAGATLLRFAPSRGERQQTLLLEKIEDRNGNRVALEYDDQGRLARIADLGGHRLALEYSKSVPGRVARVFGAVLDGASGAVPMRLLAEYGYDASGRLALVTLADGEVHREFTYHESGPGAGLLASHTLPSGLSCRYEWGDSPDHPRVIRHAASDGMEWRSTYTFLPDGTGETSVTDSLGRTRVWLWNSNKLPLRYTDATGRAWRLAWNKQHQLEQCILPGGATFSYGYDNAGKISSIADPEGGTVSYVWHGRYPLLLSFTGAEGGVTQYEYDDRGNPVLIRYPDAGEERFAFDAFGRLIEKTTPLGDTHRFEWDRAGRPVRHHDCSGNITAFGYDDVLGLLATVTDPLGLKRSLERNALGLPLAVIHPDGSAERYSWDAAGRMVSRTDALGAVTRYRYNTQDRLVEEIDAMGGVTAMRYEPDGALAALINPNGEQYRFTSDAEGRRLSYTGLDGVSTLYELDAMGLPAKIRIAAETDQETVVLLQRDKLGRVMRRSGASGVTEYAYTPGGSLARAAKTGPQGETRSEIFRSYDVMGNLVEEKAVNLLPDGAVAERVLRHEFDLAGNRVRSVLPGGERAEYVFCSSGHMHQLAFAAGKGEPERVISAFERDALNRETRRTQGRIHSRRGYDALSRLTFLHTDGFPAGGHWEDSGVPVETGPMVGKTFGYDARGELTRSEDLFSGVLFYDYDPLGRITAVRRARPEHAGLPGRTLAERLVTEEAFLYDRAGNLFSTGAGGHSRLREALPEQRLATARKTNELPVAHNRLDAIDDCVYRYDALGRVVEKRCLESERRWSYVYDSDNRLIEVEQSAPSGFRRTRFSYDALGRRTGRYDGETLTVFSWDGMRLLREENGPRAATYFYEQGGHVPLARVDGPNSLAGASGASRLPAPEAVFYYHCNAAGLPEDVTDSEGRLIWRGRYSAWGRLRYEKTTPDAPRDFVQPLRMQGQYDDGSTGLYYNTFRYYDADAGRFAAEDPIGLAGGDNLYQYAPNPMTWADPLGWSGFKVANGAPEPQAALPLVTPLGGAAAGGGTEILGGLALGGCLALWWNLPLHEKMHTLMPIPFWIAEMSARRPDQQRGRGGKSGILNSEIKNEIAYFKGAKTNKGKDPCDLVDAFIAQDPGYYEPLRKQIAKDMGCANKQKRSSRGY